MWVGATLLVFLLPQQIKTLPVLDWYHLEFSQIQGLYCILILIIFSILMYTVDTFWKWGGLLNIMAIPPFKDESIPWYSFFSSKLTTLSVFIAAMFAILTFLASVIAQPSNLSTSTGFLAKLAGLFLLLGIVFSLVGLEAYDTLSGRHWDETHRHKLFVRGLWSYIYAWYCLIVAILLVTTIISGRVTIIGAFVYSIVVPRYYFYANFKWQRI